MNDGSPTEWTRTRLAGLATGPLLALVVLALPTPAALPVEAHRLVAVTALIACWWVTEALPIPVTSLLPIVLFPVLGILGGKETAAQYAADPIFLFLGGFLIAIAIEKCGLHRTIAVAIIRLMGTRPSLVVLGFMVAAAALSMWISNTATALMMLPIALAVGRSLADNLATDRDRANLSVGLLLGVAYGCSIGGVATPVGTPPNVVFLGLYGKLFPAAPEISFSQWMFTFLPLSILCLPVAWLVLTQLLYPSRLAPQESPDRDEELPHQRRQLLRDKATVGAIFAMTAMLWMTRKDITLGGLTLPGWSNLLGDARDLVTDGTVAIAMAALLFALPSQRSDSRALMIWKDAVRVPWGILLLFGSGFAIAHAFKGTGLSEYVGGMLSHLHGLPVIALLLVVALGVTHLTELTSNTATTTILVPIAAATAIPLGVHPLLLMLPVTLAASCAFMLPVATPPNAIVFGSGQVRIGQMVRAGLILNLASAAILVAVIYWLAPAILGFDPGTVPAWANQQPPTGGG